MIARAIVNESIYIIKHKRKQVQKVQRARMLDLSAVVLALPKPLAKPEPAKAGYPPITSIIIQKKLGQRINRAYSRVACSKYEDIGPDAMELDS